jgi:DNA-binding MarR family transcriptional regulator
MAEAPEILRSRVSVPDHVVYRDFAEETVILNLDSGQYHGLNATAARMLEVLKERDSVAAAVEDLSREFGQPVEVIEHDVVALCSALSERGLIERDARRHD